MKRKEIQEELYEVLNKYNVINQELDGTNDDYVDSRIAIFEELTTLVNRLLYKQRTDPKSAKVTITIQTYKRLLGDLRLAREALRERDKHIDELEERLLQATKKLD